MTSTTIYSSPKCSCVICKKEYSSKGINSHFLSEHGTDEEKFKMRKGAKLGMEANNKIRKVKAASKLEKHTYNYNLSPNFCKQCNCKIPFSKKSNTFCSKSCSATFKNLSEGAKTEDCKLKISKKLTGRKSTHKREKIYEGPYTRLVGYFSGSCATILKGATLLLPQPAKVDLLIFWFSLYRTDTSIPEDF
jgi:hypothetical protein